MPTKISETLKMSVQETHLTSSPNHKEYVTIFFTILASAVLHKQVTTVCEPSEK